MEKVELLAPAGNMSKLKTAFHFGADAVYIGGKDFSLRAYADNFSNDDILKAVEYAHKLSKKVYVTVNIFPKNEDFKALEEYLKFLESAKVDAVLITDPGLIMKAKEVAPNLELHLSTQANNLNKYTVEFWSKYGISRVVLARELSLSDIKEIKEHNPNTEIEIFVHGAMCISYSGRCLLSNYLTDRDSNRGECVQACRWKFNLKQGVLIDAGEGDPPLEMQEDERGTYILNSKDLNLIAHIDKLVPYVDSFKIEGRMKSEYYLATVVNAYRRAIDEYYKYGKPQNIEKYKKELEKIIHRKYTTAYIDGENVDTVEYSGKQAGHDYLFVAEILKKLSPNKYLVEMRNRFKVGDTLEIISPTDAHNKTFKVEIMKAENGDEVLDAKIVQQHLEMIIPFEVEEGDFLRMKK